MACSVKSSQQYFSTLNPLAYKFSHDIEKIKEKIGENNWLDLSVKEREEIVDYHLVGSVISSKYEEYAKPEEVPGCFPRLEITPGEKIIVDFDNADGWTWRDEHSAPFSWETRSQLEMSFDLDDGDVDDDKTDATDDVEHLDKCATMVPKSKRPRTPDRGDASLAYKPEKSIWESPFLTADRGLDSGYTSSQCSDQSKLTEEHNNSFDRKTSREIPIVPNVEKVKRISPTPTRPTFSPPPPPVLGVKVNEPVSPVYVSTEVRDKRWTVDRDVHLDDEQLLMDVSQICIHGTTDSDVGQAESVNSSGTTELNTVSSIAGGNTLSSTGFDFLDNW